MINLSKYLGLGGRLDEEGIFDLVLNKDAPYFINITFFILIIVPCPT